LLYVSTQGIALRPLHHNEVMDRNCREDNLYQCSSSGCIRLSPTIDLFRDLNLK
jgi:hypothetical protein